MSFLTSFHIVMISKAFPIVPSKDIRKSATEAEPKALLLELLPSTGESIDRLNSIDFVCWSHFSWIVSFISQAILSSPCEVDKYNKESQKTLKTYWL